MVDIITAFSKSCECTCTCVVMTNRAYVHVCAIKYTMYVIFSYRIYLRFYHCTYAHIMATIFRLIC